MARIRTIKPEFWSSEQIMELSLLARLLFIAMWNFCDDGGVIPASPKSLKALAFPSDNQTSDDVARLVSEMIQQRLVAEFEADGKRFWFVTGWKKHQRIDKPTYRHPQPDSAASIPIALDEQSANGSRTLAETSTTEGNGMEGNGEDIKALADSKAVNQHCPAKKIIDAYHRLMPDNPRCKVISKKREGAIKARWNEAAKLDCKPFGYSTVQDGVAAWEQFFTVCAESPFLTGKTTPQPGKPRFVANIDFLMSPEYFVKCLENHYHREASA